MQPAGAGHLTAVQGIWRDQCAENGIGMRQRAHHGHIIAAKSSDRLRLAFLAQDEIVSPQPGDGVVTGIDARVSTWITETSLAENDVI